MSDTPRQLIEEEIAGPISSVVLNNIWTWASRHRFPNFYPKGTPTYKLKPTVKKDALRFGMMICRGAVAMQQSSLLPSTHNFDYEFSQGASLVEVGCDSKSIDLVISFYLELKPNLTPNQKCHLLAGPLAIVLGPEGRSPKAAVEFFVAESLLVEGPDEEKFDILYSMWRYLVDDLASPLSSEEARKPVMARIESLEGSKVQRTYDRNSGNGEKEQKRKRTLG